MWKRSIAFTLVLSSASCAPMATGGAYYGFSFGVASAPPPEIRISGRPELVAVSGTSVSVVEQTPYDIFRYGGTWYLCTGEFWYRARSYDGPYIAIDVRRVPKAVLTVPERRWKHHPHGEPPGRWKHHH